MSELLRIATAGSVDDGKSTLIGRLLYDSKAIFEDQWDAVEQTSRDRGESTTNLALLTDGLRAEREQGITIDVAYRYFATPHRKIIIADTPGHIQYTRNMVTGASTADLAIVLVDARKGIREQTRRHLFLSSLLGIPRVVVCINKMDLVDWSFDRFTEIHDEISTFATRLEIRDITFIPVSALHGDNIVSRSTSMGWYEGSSLLHHLEEVHIASDRNLIDARFPVQYVIRPNASNDPDLHDYRGYAGTVAGGVFRPGDDVMVLPSGFESTIDAVYGPGGDELEEAFPPTAATILLADDLDVGRGDLLCRPNNQPHVGQDIDSMVSWFSEKRALEVGDKVRINHTSRSIAAIVANIDYRLDINTLSRDLDATSLKLNEIGRVRFRTQEPLLYDEYRRNRTMGSFIVLDPHTNDTVGGGMLNSPGN